jgi:hypothetical protein
MSTNATDNVRDSAEGQRISLSRFQRVNAASVIAATAAAAGPAVQSCWFSFRLRPSRARMLCVALYRLYVASYMMYVASYMLYVASYILTLHCLWCPWYDVRLRQAPRRRSFSAGSASSRECLSTRQGTARCDERAHTRICTHICALSAADSLWHAHTAGRLYSCAHMRSGSFSATAIDIAAVAFHWLHCCAIWQRLCLRCCGRRCSC